MERFRLDLNRLKEAAGDFRYLLNRGYPRERSLELVGNRFDLDRDQRHLLRRAISSEQEAVDRKNKLMPVEALKGRSLGVDGHNVLITIETALRGETLILSDDGLIRDISGVSGKYKITQKAHRSFELVFEVLSEYRPKETSFFFDRPISRSGELAKMVRNLLKKHKLSGGAEAVKVPESRLVRYEAIATSDSALIDSAKQVIDLAGYVIKDRLRRKFITL